MGQWGWQIFPSCSSIGPANRGAGLHSLAYFFVSFVLGHLTVYLYGSEALVLAASNYAHPEQPCFVVRGR